MLKTPPTLAAELSGKTGVSISAPYANENSRILLSTTDISSENGKIKIQSYGDQYYYARQSELYTFERRSYKTGKWYNRKHITEVKEHKNAKPDAVTLSASQGIDIKSGGSIDAYATAFDAPKGSINIEAGRKLTLYAVEELNYDKLDSQKRRRFLGISYSKAHDTTTQVMKTALPSRVVAESANLQSGWDTKLQGTQFETTLGGATIRAGVGEQARADAKIILEGIKSSIHTETVSSSKSTLWQKQAGRGSNIETLQLPSFTGPVAPVLSAPGGYIVDIPKGNLKTQIETLTKQPEYAYLKQLQVAKNINWNQVQLAYDKWDYKQEGMTPAAAAVVVIVVTVLTYGALSAPAAAGTAGAAGAGAGGAAAGTAAGTGVAAGTAATTGVAAGTSAAAITTAAGKAALASLASQAAVSLINNKGDINHTLKELGKSSTVRQAATAAVTAGVLQGISGLNTQAAEAVSKHFHSPAAGKLTANLINSTAAASVHTAINGGSLKDNLGDAALGAIVSTVHGEVASKIKFNLSEDYIAHKIAHAVAGCASAVANKGKCRDGAIGAAVGEMVGETLLDGRDVGKLSPQERQKVIAYSQIIAGSAVALVKGDVNTAANAATVAVENNSLLARRRVNIRWTSRQELEHEYAILEIQAITNQIRRLDPKFNGIAIMRNPREPWTRHDVQTYRQYYNQLRESRGFAVDPIYRIRINNGNEFNRIMSSKYPYNELYVANPKSATGYFRVDSYNPATEEIISRKFTQFSQIQESTGIGYIKEAVRKYSPGAVISNVPSTPTTIRGRKLEGKLILEVPAQVNPIPQSVLRAAQEENVIIRDTTGRIYNRWWFSIRWLCRCTSCKKRIIDTNRENRGRCVSNCKCKHWISMDCQFVKAKRRS
ncbi:S-layer family protein [Neisseria meningitidis]|nr:S-layer family protein [Neisseria meningitidis]